MPSGVKKQPWDRQIGESVKAWNIFMAYLSLGADRTVTKAAEASGHSLGLCQTLSAKFKWVSRAIAWQEWMVKVQEKQIEERLQKDAIIYAERRSLYRHEEYTLAKELLQQARLMLAAPLYETTVTKMENIGGQEVAVAVTMTPTRWTKGTAATMVKVASEIMRLSLEMETARVGIVNLQDPNVRLQMARNSVEKWKKDIDQLVDLQMEANPNQDRNLVTTSILTALPQWAASDWKLPNDMLPQLTEGIIEAEEVLPLDDPTPQNDLSN